MILDFSGKRVLVTHADAFMGPALEQAFSSAGAEVISSVDDLSNTEAVEHLVSDAGHIDILLLNLAAPAQGQSVQSIEEDVWQSAFDKLVHPMYRLVKAVSPQMIERRRGKIVVIGSAAPLKGMPKQSTYSAARAAQHGYVQAAGIELAPHNVQINLIAQNWVDNPTYFSKPMQEHPRWQSLVDDAVPLQRIARGEESAALALFLASDQSDFFVGKIIPFDGGWSG